MINLAYTKDLITEHGMSPAYVVQASLEKMKYDKHTVIDQYTRIRYVKYQVVT